MFLPRTAFEAFVAELAKSFESIVAQFQTENASAKSYTKTKALLPALRSRIEATTDPVQVERLKQELATLEKQAAEDKRNAESELAPILQAAASQHAAQVRQFLECIEKGLNAEAVIELHGHLP
jgi:hypothetical protein